MAPQEPCVCCLRGTPCSLTLFTYLMLAKLTPCQDGGPGHTDYGFPGQQDLGRARPVEMRRNSLCTPRLV